LLFLTLSAIPNLISVLIAQGARLIWPDAFINFDELQFINDPQQMLRALQDQMATAAPGDTIVGFVSIIPQSLSIAALTFAAANTYLGRPVSVGGALRAALVDIPRLIVTLVVLIIAIILVWVVGIIASSIPLLLTQIAILAFLIFAAAFVLPVWLLASFALVPTISTIEDAGPFSAMGRSLRLIAGSRWRIIGVMILLFIIEIILSALLGAIFLGAFLTESTAGRVAAVLVGAAGTIAWEPLPWAALALFYYDMRVRKEAFDLQLAAEALPSTA
jgi:hypothetical protein